MFTRHGSPEKLEGMKKLAIPFVFLLLQSCASSNEKPAASEPTPAGPALVSTAERHELPIIADINGLIVVRAEFGGKPLNLLVDTGAGANFIDPDVIAGLPKISRSPKEDQVIANAQSRSRQPAYRWDYELGGFKFVDQLAFSQRNHRFDTVNDGINCCDGILGIPFIRAFPLEIDRDRKIVTIHRATPSLEKEAWATAEVLVKSVIAMECESSLGPKLGVRLDTGSEVPMILQPPFTARHQIPRKLDQAKVVLRGHPMIELGKITCGKTVGPVEMDGLVYMGKDGALAHTFADGNLGGSILGRRYVIDAAGNKIFVFKGGMPETTRLPGVTPIRIGF